MIHAFWLATSLSEVVILEMYKKINYNIIVKMIDYGINDRATNYNCYIKFSAPAHQQLIIFIV